MKCTSCKIIIHEEQYNGCSTQLKTTWHVLNYKGNYVYACTFISLCIYLSSQISNLLKLNKTAETTIIMQGDGTRQCNCLI